MATPTMPAVKPQGADPFQLVNELRLLVVIATGCGNSVLVDWAKHPQPLTVEELDEVLKVIVAHIVCKRFEAQQR